MTLNMTTFWKNYPFGLELLFGHWFLLRHNTMESLRIIINPYNDQALAREIVNILDSYASDPMGGNKPLGAFTRQNLIAELRGRPWIVCLLALVDGKPVGLMIAMEGFSTFMARPLMNIHDVAVLPEYRGHGVGKALFAEIERVSIQRGCCKLTLEVLGGNERAKGLYEKLGFRPYLLDPGMGAAEFWEKALLD
jgi:ribosomal protein S18 acetylase RimI-like enzyme